MALPLVAAAASKIIGPIAGAFGQTQDINKGMESYRQQVGQGTDVLQQGQQGSTAAFSPYTAAGTTGIVGATNDIMGRQQAQGPQLSNINAQSTQDYIDPSAAYTAQQALKQGQAAGISGGAVGGGMLKALTNNANTAAQTNWNNAYEQMLKANTTNFSQQQQQYANNNDYQQQQITNKVGLGAQGLTSNTANQQLQQQYNADQNSNYNNVAANQMSGWGKKGQVFGDAVNSFGDNLGELIPRIFG